MPGIAASRSNVHFFDNSGLLNLATDYGDTLHPFQVGYNKLGDAFATEAAQLLSAPEPGTIWTMGAGVMLLFLRLRNSV